MQRRRPLRGRMFLRLWLREGVWGPVQDPLHLETNRHRMACVRGPHLSCPCPRCAVFQSRPLRLLGNPKNSGPKRKYGGHGARPLARARLLARSRQQTKLYLQRAAPSFTPTFSAHSGHPCHNISAGGAVTAQCWTDERLGRHSAPPVCRRRRRWTPNRRDHSAVGPRGRKSL